jgi:hypothetical protein
MSDCIAEGHDVGDCCDIDCPSRVEPEKEDLTTDLAAARELVGDDTDSTKSVNPQLAPIPASPLTSPID